MFRFAFFFIAFVTSIHAQTIHITDKYSQDKMDVVSDVLSLQSTWQINIREQQTAEVSEKGFLFVKMQPEYVLELLDKDGVIIWIEDKDIFLGYIILTDINEFFDLYVNSQVRTFACMMNIESLEHALVSNNVKYIEQIAVKQDRVNKGVATALINIAKQISPHGLVAAILTKPFPNNASLNFFSRNQFKNIGYLNCIECNDWPTYQTCVMLFGLN